jgi:RNA recognition motif-containing protein
LNYGILLATAFRRHVFRKEYEKENMMGRELYVGHISYDATEEDLRRTFAVAGTVTSVHIITDPVTGKSKGCAYVRMSSAGEAEEAIECLDGALMGGLIISVSEAVPQKKQVRPPGGGKRPSRPGSRFRRGEK